MSQTFLDHSQAKLADPVPPARRKDLGLCERGKILPGILRTVQSHEAGPDGHAVADRRVAAPGRRGYTTAVAAVEGGAPAATEASCAALADPESRRHCFAIWKNLVETLSESSFEPDSCANRDLRRTLGSLLAGQPTVHLQCFLEEVHRMLVSDDFAAQTPPYGVGLLRAAIADFLFNYKVSQQYSA